MCLPALLESRSAFERIFSIHISKLSSSWDPSENYLLSQIFAFGCTEADKIGDSLI